jgi:DNA-binding PadR family transcriptional regulator
VKYFFLSLLSRQPTHGYDLLRSYEQLFSAVLPPINAGQIYTTLSRLERDGLVQKFVVEQEGKPDKRVYELTDQGRETLLAWFDKPLTRPRIKDNLYLKLMSARMTDLVDIRQIIESQRRQYLQTLHDLNVMVLQPETAEDPVKRLFIQGAILHLKADLEWLELCEEIFT